MPTTQNFVPQQAVYGRYLPYDPAGHLKGFDTDKVVLGRDTRLVARLQATGRHDLADDLRRATERGVLPPRWSNAWDHAVRRWFSDDMDAPPPWSNSWYRNFRRWFTNEAVTLAHAAKAETGYFGVVATIIPAGFTAPVDSLSAIMPREVVDLFWKKLAHIERRGTKVIGGVDVSFNEMAGANQPLGNFQVHAGLAFLGYDPSTEGRRRLHDSIKEAFQMEPTALIPVQVKELRDPIEQLSYLMKRVFVRRVSIIDNRGRRNTLARPLKSAQEAEIAAWLSGFPQTDRLILKGLRRYGDRIVPTPSRRRWEDGE